MRKQVIAISLLTAISQLVAFAKVWFTAAIFGISPELDGYNLALVLPTLITGVAAGVLQTGLFPLRARLHATGAVAEVAAFERVVLGSMLAIGLLASLPLFAFAPYIAGLLAPSASDATTTALVFALPIAAPLIVLNMVGDCTGFLLAMRNRFVIAAAAPIANGIFGTLLLAAWPQGGLLNLTLGTTIGVVIQVAICLTGLKASGVQLLGRLPSLQQSKAYFSSMLKLGGWILPGVIFSNFVASLPTVWVARYGEGAVSAFGYAYRLHSAALQLVVMASSTIILARFAELVASKNTAAVRKILGQSTIIAVILGGISVSLIAMLGPQILEVIFKGRFDRTAAILVANHWTWLTAGLAFSLLGNIFAKLWQAQARPKLISIMAGISLATFMLAHYFLEPLIEQYAVSVALSLAAASVVLAGIKFLASPQHKV